MSDSVNHPSHYNQGKIEVIEFIEDKKLGFHLGNAVKYIARAGVKNPEKTVEDLEKAIWYIRRQIEVLKGTGVRPNAMPQERVDYFQQLGPFNPRIDAFPDGTKVVFTGDQKHV